MQSPTKKHNQYEGLEYENRITLLNMMPDCTVEEVWKLMCNEKYAIADFLENNCETQEEQRQFFEAIINSVDSFPVGTDSRGLYIDAASTLLDQYDQIVENILCEEIN